MAHYLKIQTYILVIVGMLWVGCGGAEPVSPAKPATATAPDPVEVGAEELGDSDNDVEVRGTLGTIPTHLIQQRLEPKLASFQNCFVERSRQVECIAGQIELYFRVKLDGSVRSVFPRVSTIGDRETEQCILAVASRTRFPSPRGGGEAEFAWQFEVDPLRDVRPPVAWESERAASALRQHAGSIRACHKNARYTVTAYVAPGGTVLTAGAASSAFEGAGALDCVADAVRSWAMPDPGSYPAKVTFQIP
jgi:hypothetical protein